MAPLASRAALKVHSQITLTLRQTLRVNGPLTTRSLNPFFIGSHLEGAIIVDQTVINMDGNIRLRKQNYLPQPVA